MRFSPPPSSSWWPSPPAPCSGSPKTDRHSCHDANRPRPRHPRIGLAGRRSHRSPCDDRGQSEVGRVPPSVARSLVEMGGRLWCSALRSANTCERFSPAIYAPPEFANEDSEWGSSPTSSTRRCSPPPPPPPRPRRSLRSPLSIQRRPSPSYPISRTSSTRHRCLVALTFTFGWGGSSFPERACPRAVRSAGRRCRGAERW
jgi:hypothetical protein